MKERLSQKLKFNRLNYKVNKIETDIKDYNIKVWLQRKEPPKTVESQIVEKIKLEEKSRIQLREKIITQQLTKLEFNAIKKIPINKIGLILVNTTNCQKILLMNLKIS